MAQAVVEHILACYRSRDLNFPLETAQEGVVEAEEEAAREAVRSTAAVVVAGFKREVQPAPAPRSGHEGSDSDSD